MRWPAALVAQISAALRRTPARPAVAQGIRTAVVTVGPLVAGAIAGQPLAYTWVAIGAFQSSLADNGGPYRVRAASMLAVVIGGAVAIYIGTMAAPYPVLAIPLAFAAAFVSGMVRVYGSAGAVVGVNNLAMTLVALAYPSSGTDLAYRRAEFFFIGAALSAVAALVVWPFQPNNLARQAVAACFDRLAAFDDVVASLAEAADHGSDAWHARARDVEVRQAIEEARQQVAAVRLAREGGMRRGEQMLSLLIVADRILGFLIALPDLLENDGLAGPGAAAAEVRSTLETTAERLEAVAVLVRPTGAPVPAMPDLRDALRRLGAPAVAVGGASGAPASDGGAAQGLGVPERSPVAWTLQRIEDECAIAEAVADALKRGAPMPDVAAVLVPEAAQRRPRLLHALVTPLIDAWSFRSLSLRHALRLAVGVGAAQGVAMATGLPRGYWLTLTTGIILQPYAGGTVERAIQRVAGTVFGVMIAALITFVLHGPVALALILFPLTVLTFALRPINYGYFVLFLTPIFVLLAEGLHADPQLALYRLLNTVLGGALAMMCAAVLWPEWEGEALADVLASAVEGDRDYVRVVLSASPAEPAVRRAMGLATGNAEAALQRAAVEGPRTAAALVAGTTVVAALWRLGAVLAAIGAAREGTSRAPLDADEATLEASADAVLSDLATSLRTGRPPAPMATRLPGDASALPLAQRLVRQLQVLHTTVARFVAGAGAGVGAERATSAGDGGRS